MKVSSRAIALAGRIALLEMATHQPSLCSVSRVQLLPDYVFDITLSEGALKALGASQAYVYT